MTKFTKQQAVEEITAKITDKDKDLDLSRTIGECVENALKMVGENEEMELDAFVALVQPFVATEAGLAHKTGVTATKTLQEKIAELEGKTKTEPKPKDNPKKDEKPSDEMKALLERIEKLEQDKLEADKKTKIDAKRSELSSAISKLGVDDKDWVNALLKEVSVTEDTDVEQKSKDYVALYNKTHSIGTSMTPKGASGTSDDKIDLSGLDTALGQLRGTFGQENKNDK